LIQGGVYARVKMADQHCGRFALAESSTKIIWRG
jgi:hypothetical protein